MSGASARGPMAGAPPRTARGQIAASGQAYEHVEVHTYTPNEYDSNHQSTVEQAKRIGGPRDEHGAGREHTQQPKPLIRKSFWCETLK